MLISEILKSVKFNKLELLIGVNLLLVPVTIYLYEKSYGVFPLARIPFIKFFAYAYIVSAFAFNIALVKIHNDSKRPVPFSLVCMLMSLLLSIFLLNIKIY